MVPSKNPFLRCIIVLLLAHAGNWQQIHFACQLSSIHLKKHSTSSNPLLLLWFLYHLSPSPLPKGGNNGTLVSKSVGKSTVGEGCGSAAWVMPQKPGHRCTVKQGGDICCQWLTLATLGYATNVFFQVQFHSHFSNLDSEFWIISSWHFQFQKIKRCVMQWLISKIFPHRC